MKGEKKKRLKEVKSVACDVADKTLYPKFEAAVFRESDCMLKGKAFPYKLNYFIIFSGLKTSNLFGPS